MEKSVKDGGPGDVGKHGDERQAGTGNVSSVVASAACMSEILQHVDSVKDLARSALVCKLWSSVAKEEHIWVNLRQNLFGDVQGVEQLGSARSWFITRSFLRGGMLATRAEDGVLTQLGNVGVNGDIALDAATQRLVLMAGGSSMSDGSLQLSAPAAAKLRLFALGDMSEQEELLMEGRLPNGPALLACNGQGLVCATLAEGIAVCDLAKHTQLGLLQAHSSPIISLVANGSLLLSSCTKQVCIWSLSSLTLLSQHQIHLNLPFTRLDTYTRALSDISPTLGLAAFCATNTLAANNRRGEVRHILPLPIAHIVETRPDGKIIRQLQLTAVLGMCFHNSHLLVLSFLSGERHNSGVVVYGGTGMVSIYNTTTWEATKLISPWLPGLAPLHCCFQVAFGFAAFVHKNEPRRWQVWGFDLGLVAGKARVPTSGEVSSGVMCVADSDRLPLMRLWQHEAGHLAIGSTLLEEMQVLMVLSDQLLVKTKGGVVHTLGLRGIACPGVLPRMSVEANPRGSMLRHGVWLA